MIRLPHRGLVRDGGLGSTSYRHLEPENLSPNFVWAVRYAQTICHTKFLSLCSGSILYVCSLYSGSRILFRRFVVHSRMFIRIIP